MSTKNITPENGKALTIAAAADAATIVKVFHDQSKRMNRVFETIKARTGSFTFHEIEYYVPKLKKALRSQGFNPGTLGRIFAAVNWATETGQPLSNWATYMGKDGLDAAHEKYKAAARAAHQGGRKSNKTSEDTTDTTDDADVAMAQHPSVTPFDAIIGLLDRLTTDELTTLALKIEMITAHREAMEDLAEAA